jgi:inner membrane protein
MGACMARAGMNRKTALATATVTLAAEAPDLDILTEFKNRTFGFAHHRGFTHSFLGAAIMAGVVVGFIYLIWCLRGQPIKDPKRPPRWGWLFFFAYIAGISHILLDFTNNYGVRPFWPFSEKWYSWDIVFIADPVIWGVLVAGLVLPALFGLIDSDLGVRNKGPKGRWGAVLALVCLASWWGLRDYEHRRAVDALSARSYEGADPIRASAFPYWWSPFRWGGVVETKNFFATMNVDSSAPEVDPQGDGQILYKPEETPITLAAKKTYLGRVYLDWAKYPITETEQLDNGYLVRLKDLRFDYGGRTVLSGRVELDRDLNVVEESFGLPRGGIFGGRRPD